MAGLFKMFAVLLALLWLPMASHCDLEHLPGFAFLACCDHADTTPHQDDDCETDLCAAVESGLYKTEEQPVVAPAPSWDAMLLPTLALSAPADFGPAVWNTSLLPIELPQRWAFLLRQAQPPRAPSFAS